jgi:hypothetical protein
MAVTNIQHIFKKPKCQETIMVFHEKTFFTIQGNKKCGGRPLLSAVPERFPAETAVRCLCCKTDLADPEQLRLHLAVPGCTGPIYAKNAVLPPPRDSDQPLQVFRADITLQYYGCDSIILRFCNDSCPLFFKFEGRFCQCCGTGTGTLTF